MLLFQCFHKKTSVLYDIFSLCELLQKQELKSSTKEIIAHLIHLSLSYIKFHITTAPKDQLLTYLKYWEIAVSSLKLTTMNSLIQTNQKQLHLVQPLLKALTILDKDIEKEEDAEANLNTIKDLTHRLLSFIDTTEITEESYTEDIIKYSL